MKVQREPFYVNIEKKIENLKKNSVKGKWEKLLSNFFMDTFSQIKSHWENKKEY